MPSPRRSASGISLGRRNDCAPARTTSGALVVALPGNGRTLDRRSLRQIAVARHGRQHPREASGKRLDRTCPRKHLAPGPEPVASCPIEYDFSMLDATPRPTAGRTPPASVTRPILHRAAGRARLWNDRGLHAENYWATAGSGACAVCATSAERLSAVGGMASGSRSAGEGPPRPQGHLLRLKHLHELARAGGFSGVPLAMSTTTPAFSTTFCPALHRAPWPRRRSHSTVQTFSGGDASRDPC